MYTFWPASAAGVLVVWAASGLVLGGGQVAAQVARQPSQYAPADIAYGSRLYDAQCSTCHGPTGDAVSGVDLGRGQFRNASSDRDLTRTLTTGIPGAGLNDDTYTVQLIDDQERLVSLVSQFD